MRLLGWMQHKFRQNSTEPFKDFTIAQSVPNDQDSYSKSTFIHGCRSLMQTKQEYENPSSEETEKNFKNETTVISELFHGFLTIGTLGSEQVINEPATPTFTMCLENISEETTEVTESDLKLINDELEKFLEAEAEEKGSNVSSRRNSQVSTITLSGKPTEGANAEEYGKMVCPLQGYLFGSSIELPETTTEVKKEKTSLAELFHRTKITEDSSMEKRGNEEMQAKQTNSSMKHFLKKVLKKLHSSSGRSATSQKQTNSASTKTKFQKYEMQVIKMFHRKIHPESSVAEREFKKFQRYKINSAPHDGEHIGDQMHKDKDNRRLPQESKSKEAIRQSKTNSKVSRNKLKGSSSGGNGEHWIKTDADYLVLEL